MSPSEAPASDLCDSSSRFAAPNSPLSCSKSEHEAAASCAFSSRTCFAASRSCRSWRMAWPSSAACSRDSASAWRSSARDAKASARARLSASRRSAGTRAPSVPAPTPLLLSTLPSSVQASTEEQLCSGASCSFGSSRCTAAMSAAKSEPTLDLDILLPPSFSRMAASTSSSDLTRALRCCRMRIDWTMATATSGSPLIVVRLRRMPPSTMLARAPLTPRS
mmetsp:Transcript_42966/g.133541  ORF Transcript_42966/g.133541 Transcript_42966/m.133541 type:complete len:221 (-) Transcript_42966:236-898(-)